MASKLYNGKEHIFTSLGVTTYVTIKGGPGEQFQVQGTLNVVDGRDDPAHLLVNGIEVGSDSTLAGLVDVNLTNPLVTGSVLSYNSSSSKWINSTGQLLFTGNSQITVSTGHISYGTQYLNYTGNAISFGTDFNFNTGKLSFNNPCNLTVSSAYLQLNSYGGVNAYGKLLFTNNKTLQVENDSFINQNVATHGTPTFTSMTSYGLIHGGGAITTSSGNISTDSGNLITSNGDLYLTRSSSTVVARIQIGSNFWDIQHNSSDNSFTIDYNNSTSFKISNTGLITTPLQASFLAYPNANVSLSNNAEANPIFNTVSYNIGSYYNTSTGIFTVPVTGIYQFSGFITVNNLYDDYIYFELVTTSQDYVLGQENTPYPSNYISFPFVRTCKLTAGDTVYLNIGRYSQGDTTTPYILSGLANSNFSGYLIG